ARCRIPFGAATRHRRANARHSGTSAPWCPRPRRRRGAVGSRKDPTASDHSPTRNDVRLATDSHGLHGFETKGNETALVQAFCSIRGIRVNPWLLVIALFASTAVIALDAGRLSATSCVSSSAARRARRLP